MSLAIIRALGEQDRHMSAGSQRTLHPNSPSTDVAYITQFARMPKQFARMPKHEAQDRRLSTSALVVLYLMWPESHGMHDHQNLECETAA